MAFAAIAQFIRVWRFSNIISNIWHMAPSVVHDGGAWNGACIPLRNNLVSMNLAKKPLPGPGYMRHLFRDALKEEHALDFACTLWSIGWREPAGAVHADRHFALRVRRVGTTRRLTGTTNAVPVTLTIGGDSGATSVKADIDH
jgi:hypothetical protein